MSRKKLFRFDESRNTVVINEDCELLLIHEFKTLWNRDKTKDKSRVFREFSYIWLMKDWDSYYADDPEQERHLYAMKDSELTEKEWSDPDFRAAVRKYEERLESARGLKLIRSAQSMIDKFIDYFDSVDPMERDFQTGKPIFKIKDQMDEVKRISGMVEELENLENLYKKQISGDKEDIRGDATPGFLD